MDLSGNVYICAGGETFDSIARLLWRDENYASELMSVNPEQCTRAAFTGGEYLLLPEITAEAEETVSPKPVKAPWKE